MDVRVCVRVCVCVCVGALASIHSKGFICLDQSDCQGTDKRCCYFLRQVPSLPLKNEAPNLSNYPIHTLEAGRATT